MRHPVKILPERETHHNALHFALENSPSSSLKISDPNDIQEAEADRIADKVMMVPDFHHAEPEISPVKEPSMQREHIDTEPALMMQVKEDEEMDTLQMAPEIQKQGISGDPGDNNEDSTIQLKASGNKNGSYASQEIQSQLNSSIGNGESLPPLVQREMESIMGEDFSKVRIHNDSSANEMNTELQAKAFTHGNNIFFKSGEYNPQSSNGKRLLAHELAHTVQQNKGIERKIQAFRITRAASVPSLVIRRFETRLVPGKWSTLQNKLQQRDTLISSALSRATTGTAIFNALTRLSNRWPSMKTRLNNPRFNPATGTLPGRTAIANAIADDRADIRLLTGRGNRFVRGAILEFINALNNYLSDRDTLDQERIQYRRFDSLFTAPEVRTLLRAIPHATFTSADVKALVSQETGDLTNTAVHGITTGRPGYSQHIMNRRGYIGLGQHNTVARNAAIAWARRQGVRIPARPDPRRIPAESIKLVAAYLGRVMDMLYPNLPNNKPTGDELKKMVFASYNDGHRRVYQAANNFVGSRTINYTWNNIKNTSPIRSHARAYVDGIVSRIG